VLKHPNSRACALETAASFLALPVPCVPGPGEEARGREALGTRMISAGNFYSGSLEHSRTQSRLWILARAPRRTARKKGSGYENESGAALFWTQTFHVLFTSYIEILRFRMGN
jgi:hypothetical protein